MTYACISKEIDLRFHYMSQRQWNQKLQKLIPYLSLINLEDVRMAGDRQRHRQISHCSDPLSGQTNGRKLQLTYSVYSLVGKGQFFLEDFIYLFLERGKRKEKERERNISVWLPLGAPYWGPGPQPRHVS